MAFFFFLLASSLLNYSFYFNHSGTLQSSTVVCYDIVKIDKKLNLFALRQKIEFGLCKKMENFVITKTLKMPTAFCQATKSSVPFILTAILRWVIFERARANSKTQHVNSQSANVLLLPNPKNSKFLQRAKNNSYNTEKLL